MQETLVRFLGQEDLLEKATESSVLGHPWSLSWRRIRLQCRRPGFDPWIGKIPWRRERLPSLVFWPGECHGPYSPRGRNESVMTERLSLHSIHHSCLLSSWDIAGFTLKIGYLATERQILHHLSYMWSFFFFNVEF